MSDALQRLQAAFDADISPRVAGLERRRLWLFWIGPLAFCLGLAPGGLMLWLGLSLQNDLIYWAFPIAAVGAVSGGFVYRWSRLVWDTELAAAVMPSLLGTVEGLRVCSTPPSVVLPNRSALAPLFQPHSQTAFGQHLEGTHRGVAFSVTQATLESGGGKNRHVVFHGLVIKLTVPIPSPGVIWIGHGYGWYLDRWGGIRGQKLPEVRIDHPYVGDVLEVRSDAPKEAATYLPPGFIDILVEISRAEGQGRRAITAVFDGDTCYIALGQAVSKRFLLGGAIPRSVKDLRRDLPRLARNMTLPHRIIDRLAGDDV